MANLVSVERARVFRGPAPVLDGISLGVLAGDRIAVVGRNGGGKSTLVALLAGRLRPDEGRVAVAAGLTAGVLDQEDTLPAGADVREVLVGDRPEHEWAGDPRVREVLAGLLGGPEAPVVGGLDAAVGPLSGGERRRLALAALLLADPDLLLLDEPTNHLDVEAVAWLAGHLATRRTRPGTALVVVTHDRWFVDAVATATWEVSDGAVHLYDGGYAAYVLARAERERTAEVREQRRANLLRKELAWLRRGPPARTTKPRFRMDAAAALVADEPPPRDQVSLQRFATTRLGKDVVDLEDVTVRLGDRTLLRSVTWRLGPGDRVGVIGVNGAGKSTLLSVVAGTVAVASGRRKVGKTVRLGYLSQEVAELAEVADLRVVDAVAGVAAVVRMGDKEVSASQLAQRLGFSGNRQQARVRDLSGGERRRLQLTRLLMTEPNVLLLDEPTNDLDIETLTSLEDVLDGWAGTLLVVSHDRYLLERVCDRQVALFGDGSVRDLPGGVEEYLTRRAGMPSGGAVRVGSPQSPDAPAPGAVAPATRPGQGTRSGGLPAFTSAATREARKELARLERQMDRLSQQESRLHEALAEHATDPVAVLRLDAELRSLTAQREAVEEAWLIAADALG